MPRLLRADCGTENTNLAFIQPFLRRNHIDCFCGSDSFRYGKSVTNQVKNMADWSRQSICILIFIADRVMVVYTEEMVHTMVG